MLTAILLLRLHRLERARRDRVAVIYDPTRDELFAAERGQGAP